MSVRLHRLHLVVFRCMWRTTLIIGSVSAYYKSGIANQSVTAISPLFIGNTVAKSAN